MNKQIFYRVSISIITGFLIIWLTAFAVYLSQNRQPKAEPPQMQAPSAQPQPKATISEKEPSDTPQAVSASSIAHYLAVIQNGRIAVYEVYTNGSRQLRTVLEDIDPAMLRTEDRKSFEKGILLYSEEELASLIEDFSS